MEREGFCRASSLCRSGPGPQVVVWNNEQYSSDRQSSQVVTNITYYGNLGHVNNDKNILVRDGCCSVAGVWDGVLKLC